MKCIECGAEIGQDFQCAACGADNRVENESDTLVRLVIDAKNNDKNAVNDLMAYAYPFMMRTARCFCRNDADAQDVVQDASVKILRSLDTLQEPKTFRSWMNRIVRNTALDFLDKPSNRHDIHFTELENTEDGLSYDPEDERITSRPDLQMSDLARKEIITEILDSLKEEQRVIAVMYFYEGMSMNEIADELNIRESTVIGRIQTAKKNIRASVEKIQKRDDIKLYNLSPIAWFIWLLKGWNDSAEEAGTATLQNAAARYNPRFSFTHAAGESPSSTVTVSNEAVQNITAASEAAAVTAAALTAAGSAPEPSASPDTNSSLMTDSPSGRNIPDNAQSAASPKISAGMSTAAKAGIAAAIVAVGAAAIFGIRRLLKKAEPEPEPVVETAPAESNAEAVPEETPEPIAAVWVHEPDIALDHVYELKTMETCVEFNGREKHRIPFIFEQNGYPQTWDENRTGYTPDSIAVQHGNLFGIYDYSGTALFDFNIQIFAEPDPRTDIHAELNDPASPIRYYPVDGVLYYLTAPSDYSTYPIPARAFSTDFKSDYALNWGGYSGMFFGAFACGGRLLELDYGGYIDYHPTRPQFLMNVTDMAYIGSGEEYSHISGFSCVDENGIRYEVSGYPYNFVNGYFAMDASLEHTYGIHVFSDQNQIMKADDGQPLNDEIYEAIKFFEDGYCPVKKNGKWGFINEQGEEVTDFIWDNVSTLYEGKAYVGINGVYGVIDLVSSLENGKLTLKTVYGESLPEASAENMAADSVSQRLGNLEVKVTLNVRTGPGTDYDKVSESGPGTVYDVYETVENEGYTWYRISATYWIADHNGHWVEYTPE